MKTREQIEKMEAGRETDALVETVIFGNAVEWHDFGDEKAPMIAGEEVGKFYSVVHYSTDFAPAWKAIEEVTRRNCMVTIQRTYEGNWRCTISARGGDGPDYQAFHRSVCVAICRAALLAFMEREE